MFAVAAGEGGRVFDGAVDGAAGEGVVGDGTGEDVTGGGVAEDAVPGGRGALGGVEDAGALPLGAGEAHIGEAAVVGKDNAAMGVVPSVGFVALEDGELDTVDGLELVQGHAQGHGREDIDLHQGLPPLVVGPQGGVPGPGIGEGGELFVLQTVINFRPRSPAKVSGP